MQETCHRCGGDLPEGRGESPFCPHCGAPQLTLALENQSVETGGEPALGPDGKTTSGAVPPPRPRQVEWKTAIRCAAVVAAIGAGLMLVGARVDALSPVSLMWLLSASMITLALYQRRLPAARMDVRVGARIGVVVGVCLTLGLAMSMAGWGLVERYALHGMGSFDAQMAAQMVQMQQQLMQRAAEQQTVITPAMKGFMNSPEFLAGTLMAGYAMLSAALLAVSTLGGAFGGLLRTRRRA
jgi:hypothetical protein